MGFRGFVGSVAVIALVLAGYGAAVPERVAEIAPSLGPLAREAHDLLPASLGGPAASASSPELTASAPKRPPVSVVVAQVERKDMPWRVEEIGTAQSMATVALRPHFDATVDKVLIDDGAEVKAGQTLIELDSRQVVAQLEGGKAQLAKDTAQLEQSKRDVARYTDLVARSATPVINLDNARTAVATGEAAILGDQATIDNLKVQLGWYTVKAPITGRVGVVSIREGNVAKAGDNVQTAVFATINQISPIYVTFSVPQSLLPMLREAMGKGASVTATPQGAKIGVEGKLALIDNTVDANTGTIVVRAIFENADETLWPGQLCNVTLTLRTDPNAVVAPREAVQIGQNGNYVFVVADGVAQVRPIEIGRAQREGTIVLKGLEGGESVVVDGALLLVDGSKVEIRQPQKGAT